MFNYQIDPPMPLPGETHDAFVKRSKDIARRDAIYFATLEANIETLKHPYVETECTVVEGSKILITSNESSNKMLVIENVHSYYAGDVWLVVRQKDKANAFYYPVRSILSFAVSPPESNA